MHVGRKASCGSSAAFSNRPQICPVHAFTFREREPNKNITGFIQQYFPKGRDLTIVREHEVEQAMDKLNHHPIKPPACRTPREAFHHQDLLRYFSK